MDRVGGGSARRRLEALIGGQPLLLAGYRGLKERAATIQPEARERVPQAAERLVKLYEATGNASEAATWRGELARCRVATRIAPK